MSEEPSLSRSFPRPGSVEYKFLFADKEQKQKSLKRWKRLNKYFTIPFYKIGFIPLIGGGKFILLLFTKGRKTGKQRITPLEYRTKDGIIHVAVGRGKKAHWFQNMLANPDSVKIRKGFKKFPVKFEVVESIEEKNEFLQWYVQKFAFDAGFLFGWDRKKDNPETADFTSFTKLLQIVRFYPKH